MFLEKLRTMLKRKTLSESEIIARLDPWSLAVAVGVTNGSVYASNGQLGMLTFDSWWNLVNKDDWRKIGVSDQAIRQALQSYARANSHKHMNQVMHEEELNRGLARGIVLGPGQSMEIQIPFVVKDEK